MVCSTPAVVGTPIPLCLDYYLNLGYRPKRDLDRLVMVLQSDEEWS